MREIQIMRRLADHKNIVNMIEVISSQKGEPIIIMEFCNCSLLELLMSDQHQLVMGLFLVGTRTAPRIEVGHPWSSLKRRFREWPPIHGCGVATSLECSSLSRFGTSW